jgi:hypothetical protein
LFEKAAQHIAHFFLIFNKRFSYRGWDQLRPEICVKGNSKKQFYFPKIQVHRIFSIHAQFYSHRWNVRSCRIAAGRNAYSDFDTVLNGIKIVSSIVGTRKDLQKALRFAAEVK